MVILSFMLVFSTFAPVFGATVPVNDYDSHWAKVVIKSAMDSGTMKGYPDGSFRPDNSITRAEFFSLVNNVFKYTEESQGTYTDVEGNSWYASDVAKAKAAGYVSGYPDGTIHPETSISRQETAIILSHLKSLAPVSNILPFTDASSVAGWSKQAVIAAFEAKVMVGYPNGSFKPEAQITRAEALVAVNNCLNYKAVIIDPVVVAVKDITVNHETMTLTAGGDTEKITATITPQNATNKDILWTSSDKDVATVKDGVVTPVAVGTATITGSAEADKTKTATTIVTVVKADSEAVTPPVNPPVKPAGNPVDLGKAGSYVILAKTGISTVPSSIITGNIGVSPIGATGLTGFSLTADATNLFSTSSQITGKAYASNYAPPTPANLTTAVSDMETAYTDAAGRAADYTELYSGDISGRTLTAGAYKWGTGVLINSDVTLSGSADDVWIFQIGEGITQANGTKIILTGGAQAKNVFWQTAETVSIGTDAHAEGIILCMTNITLGTNSSINGRLFAQTAVTLDATTVVAP